MTTKGNNIKSMDQDASIIFSIPTPLAGALVREDLPSKSVSRSDFEARLCY